MKKVFWIVAGLLLIGGVVWFSALNIGPRSIRKVKLMPLESPQVLANVIGLRLQEELRRNPVLMVGVDPGDTFAINALRLFLQSPPPNVPPYDEVWVDEAFQSQFPGREVFLRNNSEAVTKELDAQLSQGRRVLVITSPVYASTLLQDSPAWLLSQRWEGRRDPRYDFISLIFTDFPRRREDEGKQKIPCVLEHSDQTGTGPLGCQALQMGRLDYRKRLTPGQMVGLMNQINRRDFLFVLTTEPGI